ncbi:MAG: N-acetyltransferase family protein, partial [Erysipelotrichaceae bacterium]
MEEIRLVNLSDAPAIIEIYRPYVEASTVSFETEVPSIEGFEKRIEKIRSQYPYLVYTIDKKVVGYAYASKHRDRAAYDYAVEVSIYTREKVHGTKVAQKLYQCLFELLHKQGYYVAYIGYTVPNEASRKFHEKMGFEWVGTY